MARGLNHHEWLEFLIRLQSAPSTLNPQPSTILMPRKTSYIAAALENTRPLIGATITGLIADEGPEYYGFTVRLKNGQKRDVWVNCDPEGNGPGHLNIEPDQCDPNQP